MCNIQKFHNWFWINVILTQSRNSSERELAHNCTIKYHAMYSANHLYKAQRYNPVDFNQITMWWLYKGLKKTVPNQRGTKSWNIFTNKRAQFTLYSYCIWLWAATKYFLGDILVKPSKFHPVWENMRTWQHCNFMIYTLFKISLNPWFLLTQH